MRPPFADTLERSPARRSRPRSGSSPVSSITTRSKPAEWPAPLSALRVSSFPHADSITPGYGDRRIRTSRPEASAIAATWVRSSDAFSFEIEAIAPRHPGRRKGPHKWPRANTAQIADFAFFASCRKGTFVGVPSRPQEVHREVRQLHRLPRRSMPRGDPQFSRLQAASAPTGSSGTGTASTGGDFARPIPRPIFPHVGRSVPLRLRLRHWLHPLRLVTKPRTRQETPGPLLKEDYRHAGPLPPPAPGAAPCSARGSRLSNDPRFSIPYPPDTGMDAPEPTESWVDRRGRRGPQPSRFRTARRGRTEWRGSSSR